MSEPTDPRLIPGDIAGPGGPHDVGGVVLDITNAVLLDYQTVSTVELHTGGEPSGHAIALLLEGRINKTQDRARVLFLTNEDGAAALVSEVLALASRAEKSGMLPGFGTRLLERIEQLNTAGNT